MLKSIIKNGLAKLGLEVHYTGNQATQLTMEGALGRCRARGVQAASVIDVGASDGRWSLDTMRFFPDAKYLMIEAQEPHRAALEAVVRKHSNMNFVLAAAGKKEGKLFFDNSSLFGGLASETPLEGASVEVPVVSIDQEIANRKLQPPYIIKLDTHGFEVPILEGATQTLKNASLVIIEVYNYQVTDHSLRFFEMCNFMRERGFLPIELVDFMLRARDNSFWQMDLFFLPASSKEFTYNEFD